jgi:hypothetical protein
MSFIVRYSSKFVGIPLKPQDSGFKFQVFRSPVYFLSPLLYQCHHIGRQFTLEIHFLASCGMLEAQRSGMQGLSGTEVHAVTDECLVG